jgi:biotin carboxylase
MLGFRVRNAAQYRAALEATRSGIGQFAVNLNQIMDYADVPPDIRKIDGWHCIAEKIISSGRQCTLEGYVFEGEPVVYGVVDSIRGPNRSSFERYQYPSTLPPAARRRMILAAKRVVSQAGLDNSPFNIEFFWDRRTDRISLLEINARISKSHSPLFDKVEGVPHKEVMIDVALGCRPEYPLGKGDFRHAAKFMLRRYDCRASDIVRRAPTEAELSALERRFPGTEFEIHVTEGMRLGDLRFRDSYSCELAVIFAGAQSQRALMRKYREIRALLPIRIERAKRVKGQASARGFKRSLVV